MFRLRVEVCLFVCRVLGSFKQFPIASQQIGFIFVIAVFRCLLYVLGLLGFS